MPPSIITFYSRFEADILADKKTITIRDASESDYLSGGIITAASYETGHEFCQLKILSVNPVQFSALSELHAKQENMTLAELKRVISDIYPNQQQLYVVSFQRVATTL